MDIIKELNNLPNFGYVFLGDDGKEHIAVLGCQTCRKTEEYPFWWTIVRINDQMLTVYSQSSLSDEDKIYLAKQMQKMYSVSETRKEGLFTIAEQNAYLGTLSPNELSQLEKQITMHKDCRYFFRDYL